MSCCLRSQPQEGTILEIYRGFNASWTNASKYFDSPSAIDTSMLTPCNGTRLMMEVAMETYLFITGSGMGKGFQALHVMSMKGQQPACQVIGRASRRTATRRRGGALMSIFGTGLPVG